MTTLETCAGNMDLYQRLAPVRRLIDAHLEPLVVVHLMALAVLGVLAAGVLLEPFRRTSRRHLAALALILLAAWGIRAWIIPALTGHVFDGHEADYFDVWRHAVPQPDFAYRASRTLRILYRWVGPLFGGSGWWLVVLHLAASLLIPVMVWSWLSDLTGSEEAGLWAGALLAADPVLGFWSSSAYNILLPCLLSVATLTALEPGLQRAGAATVAFALTCWAGAVALRPEAVLLTVPVGWRLVASRRVVMALPTRLVTVGVPLLGLLAYLVEGQQTAVGGEGAGSLLAMFRRQVLLFDYLTPYNTWPCVVVLMVSIVAVWAGLGRRRWVVGYLLATAASQHAAFAAFDDYGYRHTLVIRLSLAALVGAGIACLHQRVDEAMSQCRVRKWCRFLAAPAVSWAVYAASLVPLLDGVLDIQRRYYASSETFYRSDPRFRTLPPLEPATYSGCVWVAESDCLDVGVRASHFELFDADRLSELEALSHDCILFAYDRENFQASSRSIHARAVKVARFFHLEPVGKVAEPERECYALVFRVKRR